MLKTFKINIIIKINIIRLIWFYITIYDIINHYYFYIYIPTLNILTYIYIINTLKMNMHFKQFIFYKIYNYPSKIKL